MDNLQQENRRFFLKSALATGGGLILGFHLQACDRREKTFQLGDAKVSLNAWIHIDPDDNVTLMTASSEMGQGTMTALSMILADELEADWTKVKAQFAPVHAEFNNPLMGSQATGGSTAVRGYWEPLRQAGASARELLVAAAAKTWNVPVETCIAYNSRVTHRQSNRALRYGELLAQAATMRPPAAPRLKDVKDFRLVGKRVHRLDGPAKVNGSAVFGQDVYFPGLLTAVVARAPVFGGKLRSSDPSKTLAVKGVRHVVALDSGVAVVADDYWSAQQGRAALKLEWDPGRNSTLSSATISDRLGAAVSRAGEPMRNDGDAMSVLAGGGRIIEAEYETPYLAHACMEPMNCTAHVRSDGCEVWVPTQAQTQARDRTAEITGLPASAIRINTTFLGGGFGRRLRPDFLIEAVALSKAIAKPVKVLWTREDDLRHGFFRPANRVRVRAALGANGQPSAWFQRVAGPKHALDGLDVAYAIPNVRLEKVEEDPGVPSGPWRSVGSSQNAFSVECFIDELAHAANQDPLNYRLKLLGNSPQHRRTLELAAKKSNWGQRLAPGRGRGIAVYHAYEGCVTHVVEITVAGNRISVDRVVSAIDCGMIINPDGVVAQVESAVIFALTAALKGEITIDQGGVTQSNFDNYPLLTMAETPKIEVHLVPSSEKPGGVGEAGVPPLAPALANAVFSATGRRIRKLPIRL